MLGTRKQSFSVTPKFHTIERNCDENCSNNSGTSFSNRCGLSSIPDDVKLRFSTFGQYLLRSMPRVNGIGCFVDSYCTIEGAQRVIARNMRTGLSTHLVIKSTVEVRSCTISCRSNEWAPSVRGQIAVSMLTVLGAYIWAIENSC